MMLLMQLPVSLRLTSRNLNLVRMILARLYNYTVEEVKGTDSTVSYDGMVATSKGFNFS